MTCATEVIETASLHGGAISGEIQLQKDTQKIASFFQHQSVKYAS